MSEENEKQALGKGIFQRINKIYLWLIGALVGISSTIGIIKNFDWIIDKYNAISTIINLIPKGYLIGVVVICLGIIIYFASIKKSAPKNYIIYPTILITLSLILLVNQRDLPSGNFVIVYDSEHTNNKINIRNDVITKQLKELPKLMGIGQVTKNSNYISLVEKPVEKWESTFPNGLKLNKPVISVKEVLQKENSNFIDVSMSSYQEDILDDLKSQKDIKDIRIYFDSGFEEFVERIRTNLRAGLDSVDIQPLLFDSNNKKILSNEESVLIFLGKSKSCKTFLSQAQDTKFKHLILPSWISTISTQTEPTPEDFLSGYLFVSNLQHKLTSNDLDTWDKFLTIIKDEDLNSNNFQFKRNVQSKVFAAFTKSNKTIKRYIVWN